jgi:hypothetical protein
MKATDAAGRQGLESVKPQVEVIEGHSFPGVGDSPNSKPSAFTISRVMLDTVAIFELSCSTEVRTAFANWKLSIGSAEETRRAPRDWKYI